jgi:hypothetical protein
VPEFIFVSLEYREYKAIEQGDVSGLLTDANTPVNEGQGRDYRQQNNDHENQGGMGSGGGGMFGGGDNADANARPAPAQARAPALARNSFQGTGITLRDIRWLCMGSCIL